MKRALGNALLLLGGLALALLLGEALARAFRAYLESPQRRELRRVLTSDPLLQHVLIPNRKASWGTAEFTYDYVINSWGMRDREYVVPKPEGTFRILMLGDSYTQGAEVALEDTFSKQLERLLNGGTSVGRYEVLNGGVGSYSPILSYLWLKERMIHFEPNLVVMNLNLGGDATDDRRYTQGYVLDERGLPLAPKQEVSPAIQPDIADLGTVPVPRFLRTFLSAHSRLYLLAREQWRRIRQGRFLDASQIGDVNLDFLAPVRSGPYDHEAFWSLTFRYVQGIRDYLQERNIPLVITLIPMGNMVSTEEWKEGRKAWLLGPEDFGSTRSFELWRAYGRQNGIPVLDPIPALRASSLYPLYYAWDGHWTAKGHGVVAEAIYTFLQRRRLLPS